MWADLDMAELDEVNRRVVTPVVEAMMRTGELSGVEIGVGLPPGWSPGALDVVDCPIVWVRLLAVDDELVVQLGKITMERWSSQQLVEELVEAINDWVPETSFGWGDRPERQGPAELPAADDAPTVLRFYPDDAVRWPLWLRGEPVEPAELGLSTALIDRLAAWHQDYKDAFPDDADIAEADYNRLKAERAALAVARGVEVADRYELRW